MGFSGSFATTCGWRADAGVVGEGLQTVVAGTETASGMRWVAVKSLRSVCLSLAASLLCGILSLFLFRWSQLLMRFCRSDR